jgi:1-acyl-sn-glycerol-3-phosphate acyltransferase
VGRRGPGARTAAASTTGPGAIGSHAFWKHRRGEPAHSQTIMDGAPFSPNAAEIMAAKALLAPWRAVTDPRIDGFENLPTDGRYLLVGNHTTLGLFDVPFLVLDIYDRTGVLVRSLGERQHYRVPLWRDLLTHFGTISGTRQNTRRLLRSGQAVLVFPGGGREVARRHGQHYPLVWRERIGFARLALEFGYPVVPFSMIGVDDMWDVVIDADDALYAPARALATRLDVDPELLFPIIRGLGPTPLPRPQRIYGRLAAPIDAQRVGTSWEDTAGAAELRDYVRAAVARGINQLEAEREHDPARQLAPRLRDEALRLTRAQLAALRRILPGVDRSPGNTTKTPG